MKNNEKDKESEEAPLEEAPPTHPFGVGSPPSQQTPEERLAEELSLKTAEAAENLDKYLRKCADFENYKKRVEKEKTQIVEFANEGLIREILEFIDNLTRALEHSRDEDNASKAESLKNGVALTLKNILEVLKKSGLEEIKTEGAMFDPSMHQALGFEETSEFEENAVTKEVQKGYTFKGRLLRPTFVIVAKKKAPVEKE